MGLVRLHWYLLASKSYALVLLFYLAPCARCFPYPFSFGWPATVRDGTPPNGTSTPRKGVPLSPKGGALALERPTRNAHSLAALKAPRGYFIMSLWWATVLSDDVSRA